MNKLTNHRKSPTAAWTSKLTVWALVFGFVFLAFSANYARAANIVVTSAADNSSGATLRDAINTANSNGQADTITFSLPAGSTITPTSPLPALTEAGTSVVGSTTGTPTVELSGASAGDPAIGLRISAANCTVRGLIINRFTDSGIRIDTNANNTIIAGNYIGTNAAGNSSACGAGNCGNFNRGILIVGTGGNQIGGTSVADRNVISGNLGVGISITNGGVATISGNYIGVNVAGTGILSNSQEGIRIVDSSGNTVGGTTAAARNVISGNNSHGVVIIQSGNRDTANNLVAAANNQITGNYIGVDAGGNTRLRNNGSGVLINAAGNIVGGANAASSNVLSGNTGNGVSLSSAFASGNTVRGNYIGVGADGTTAIGNRDNGVQISSLAAVNFIGGTSAGQGNVIANNGDINSSTSKAGVYVDPTAAARNAIRGNSIHDNMGIGIDLDAVGATANDANDPDTGANNLQNFPVISAADSNGVIAGMLNSLPSTVFAIDFYSNTIGDAGSGEGRTYIGTTNVVTDASGNATVGFAATATVTAGQSVTATATNLTSSIGDTSEFAAAQTVTAATAANAAGIEADVFPRGSGDGAVSTSDVAQIKRFSLSQDRPYQSNEFQRADCFPVESRGDGVISSADVGQAKRYQLGLDSLQTAGGPTTGTPARPDPSISVGKARGKSEKEAPQAPRTVRVVSATTNPNSTVTVTIGVDAMGDESIYGFSINYNSDGSNRLTNPVVNNPSPATRQVATSLGAGNTNPGEFGVNVDFSGAGNGQIGAGNNQTLISVTFTVPASAMNGTVPITFTNTPTVREVTSDPNDGPIQILPTTFTNGTVTIGAAQPAVTRTVRVVNTTTNRGSTVTVTIGVDAMGDESIYGFSINYNSDGSNRLTNPVVNNPSPATRQVTTSLNAGNTNPGQFGVNVDFSGAGNGQIGAGNGQTLITVTFTVPISAMSGVVPITFTNTPTVREVTSDPNDGPIQILPTAFTDGTVTIAAAPTAASVTVKGRVMSGRRAAANVRVLMTDASGRTRSATTDASGYYQFANVAAGETYIFRISAKRMEFPAQTVQINEDIDGLNFNTDH